MAIEFGKTVRVDDTLEMGYYIDDCTDPWKSPETVVLLSGCRKPRQLFYAWIPTLARELRVIRPHFGGHWDSTPAPKALCQYVVPERCAEEVVRFVKEQAITVPAAAS